MIYLDHAATAPLRPEALEAMQPWLGLPANPASVHQAGQRASAAVERARAQVAALVGADPAGVVFTSGATEANHLYLRGVLGRGGRLVRTPFEHACVVGVAEVLADAGVVVDVLDAGSTGVARLPDALPPRTVALSVMAASHETGVIQPLAAARALADAAGAALHVDATQAAGRVPLHVTADGLVLSAHKLGGPAGVGALVLRDAAPFPALFPGSQERGRRGGSVNVAGVVGFGAAAAAVSAERAAVGARLTALHERLEAGLRALGGEVIGAEAARVPGLTCVVFPQVRGEAVVQALDLRGVCVSAGAACASGAPEPSAALRAMGHPEPAGIVRISSGARTRGDDVDGALAALADVLPGLRVAARLEADVG